MKRNFIRVVSLFISLVMVLSLVPVVATAAITADTSWYGDGKAETFTIADAGDLMGFYSLLTQTTPVTFSGKTVQLGADIYLNGSESAKLTGAQLKAADKASLNSWAGVSKEFAGTFDGNGKTIYGLYIPATGNATGFFGGATGTIKDLTIDGAYVTGAAQIGVLVGDAAGALTISGCTIKNALVESTGTYVGGLLGRFAQTGKALSITGCTVESTTVTSNKTDNKQAVAGVVGYLQSGYATISNTSANVTVSGTWDTATEEYTAESRCGVAAIIGRVEATGTVTITGATASGSITGTAIPAAGIIGLVSGHAYVSVTGSTAGNLTVSGLEGYVAAIIGNISNSKAVIDENNNTVSNVTLNTVAATTKVANNNGANYVLPTADTTWYTNAPATADGSAADKPYIIADLADLIGFNNLMTAASDPVDFTGKYVKLTNNISVTAGILWNPYGTFKGNFNGNGKTVSGIHMIAVQDNAGFFGIASGNIYDLTLENVNFASCASNAAALVGNANGALTISNVTVSGAVSGVGSVGGVVGKNNNAGLKIANVDMLASVTGTSYPVGGVLGNTSQVFDISGCLVTGAVSNSANRVGGVVGELNTTSDAEAKITNCVVKSDIDGGKGQMVGGFLGYHVSNALVTISSSVFEGKLTGTNVNGRIGGAVGYLQGAKDTKQPKLAVVDCLIMGEIASTVVGGGVGGIAGAHNNTNIGTLTVTNTLVGINLRGKGSLFNVPQYSSKSEGGANWDKAKSFTLTNVHYLSDNLSTTTVGGTGTAAVASTEAAIKGTNPMRENWTVVPNALPLPSGAKALYEGKDVSVAVLGSQYKDNADGSRDYRIVAVVNNYVAGSAIGMNITIGEVTETVYCTVGYKSITAAGANITAESVGGEFFVTVVIKGVPTNADYTVSVTPFTQATEQADPVDGGSATLTWAKVAAAA